MYKYTGILIFYFATGEGIHPFIIVDHPTENIWAKTCVFEKKGLKYLKIIHPKTKEVVYEGQWTFSRKKTAEANYFATPEEIDSKVWLKYCQEEYIVEINIDKKIEAERSKINLTSKVILMKEENDEVIGSDLTLWRCLEGERLELANGKGRSYYSEEPILNMEFNEKQKQVVVRTRKENFILKLIPT